MVKDRRSLKYWVTLAIVMAGVILLLFAFTQSSYAITRSGSCGENLNWELDEDSGILNITGSGRMGDYTTYGQVPWNSYKTRIKKVVINNGVTSIGNYAFYQATLLAEVTIPESVTDIGANAFYGCRKLGDVVIPNSVTVINESAFGDCDSLVSITIPGSVTSIGSDAFALCANIESITLSNGIQSIGTRAFHYCESLKRINIPSSLISIEKGAFSSCSKLKEVYIDDIASYLAVAFEANTSVPTYYRANLYINNQLVEDLVIPEGVAGIGSYAFYACQSLKSVTIPEGVTYIGGSAFYNCSNLKSITIPASVTSISSSSFSNIASDYTVYAPKDSYAAGVFSSAHVEIRCTTHQWDTEYKVDKEATCTEEGSWSIHCSVCGMIKDDTVEAIPAKGHTFDQEIPDQKYLKSEGNCTTNPALYYKSCLCGEHGEETFEYAQHTWNTSYTVDVKANCLRSGIKSIHCAECDAVKPGSRVIIPRIETYTGDHVWNDRMIRKATIFATGIEEHVCAGCGETYRTQFNWALDKPESYWNIGYNVIGHSAIFKNSKSVTVRLQNPVRGSEVRVKIGSKTYKKKVTSNSKVKIKIKKPKYGKKVTINVYYKGRLIGRCYDYIGGQYPENDIVYYAKNVKLGMTKKQVKCLYNWGEPYSISSRAGGWTFWHYYGGSFIAFKHGKVVDWYAH